MTPEAQCKAIAEAMGWSFDKDGQPYWIHGRPPLYRCDAHFTSDLNAMHEAIKVLDEKQAMEFCFALQKVVCGGYSLVTGPLVVNATASQRAEAFLRTIGKWQD